MFNCTVITDLYSAKDPFWRNLFIRAKAIIDAMPRDATYVAPVVKKY